VAPPPAPITAQQQHAAETLARAVHVVFGEWTALRLAVENEWAGAGTRERGLALLQRVRDGLLSSAAVHRDELEDLLDAALIDDFNIEAEDDSPAQIAVLLCALHTEARAGVTTTADTLLQRSAGKSTWVEVPPPPKAPGAEDSDDDCIDEDEEDEGGGGGGGGGSSSGVMDMDEDGGGGGGGEGGGGGRRVAPEVDEDGFQAVAPRRNPRRGARS